MRTFIIKSSYSSGFGSHRGVTDRQMCLLLVWRIGSKISPVDKIERERVDTSKNKVLDLNSIGEDTKTSTEERQTLWDGRRRRDKDERSNREKEGL